MEMRRRTKRRLMWGFTIIWGSFAIALGTAIAALPSGERTALTAIAVAGLFGMAVMGAATASAVCNDRMRSRLTRLAAGDFVGAALGADDPTSDPLADAAHVAQRAIQDAVRAIKAVGTGEGSTGSGSVYPGEYAALGAAVDALRDTLTRERMPISRRCEELVRDATQATEQIQTISRRQGMLARATQLANTAAALHVQQERKTASITASAADALRAATDARCRADSAQRRMFEQADRALTLIGQAADMTDPLTRIDRLAQALAVSATVDASHWPSAAATARGLRELVQQVRETETAYAAILHRCATVKAQLVQEKEAADSSEALTRRQADALLLMEKAAREQPIRAAEAERYAKDLARILSMVREQAVALERQVTQTRVWTRQLRQARIEIGGWTGTASSASRSGSIRLPNGDMLSYIESDEIGRS